MLNLTFLLLGLKKKQKRKEKDGIYSVPNLKLDRTTVDGDHASSELDTNGEIMHGLESLVSELQEQTRFPYTCITPNYYSPTKKERQKKTCLMTKYETCVSDDDVLEEVVVRHGR